jgi:hypothetical protein
VEEELPRVLVRPVLRQGVLLLGVLLDRLDNLFQSAVFSDQLQRSRRPDLGDRVEIVAAEQNAEVDKL